MVAVVFGVFNIITAIFVEATLSGLKNNDEKKKYSRLYEAHFVQTRLVKLVRRVNVVLGRNAGKREHSSGVRHSGVSRRQFQSTTSIKMLDDEEDVVISEKDFAKVVEDTEVNNIFD